MAREFPAVPFERYADDAVVHCVTERQARLVRRAIADGWLESGCGCTRTRRRSCTARTAKRRDSYEHTVFTFLGFTFRARRPASKTG